MCHALRIGSAGILAVAFGFWCLGNLKLALVGFEVDQVGHGDAAEVITEPVFAVEVVGELGNKAWAPTSDLCDAGSVAAQFVTGQILIDLGLAPWLQRDGGDLVAKSGNHLHQWGAHPGLGGIVDGLHGEDAEQPTSTAL